MGSGFSHRQAPQQVPSRRMAQARVSCIYTPGHRARRACRKDALDGRSLRGTRPGPLRAPRGSAATRRARIADDDRLEGASGMVHLCSGRVYAQGPPRRPGEQAQGQGGQEGRTAGRGVGFIHVGWGPRAGRGVGFTHVGWGPRGPGLPSPGLLPRPGTPDLDCDGPLPSTPACSQAPLASTRGSLSLRRR